MKITDLYQSIKMGGQESKTAHQVIAQAHWFAINAEFDPKTGEALPQPLSSFLKKVANPKPNAKKQDRLYRITDHARLSVQRLFRALNESPRREHALLPVRAVRELDANSFVKLSTRPGRNIREKLAGKPYLQAVRRFQSIDLPENRLLKAYVSRLAELLELRQDCLSEPEDDLLSVILSWLRSEESQAIGRWDNLPPNNTLLSHRDYRRVWDSWRWLLSLDDDISRDMGQLEARAKTIRYWNGYAEIYRDGFHLIADMPVFFDYEGFEIRSWTKEIFIKQVSRQLYRSPDEASIRRPVCVDLSRLHPCYAHSTRDYAFLRENYLWQHWRRDEEVFDLEIFNSDAACLHEEAYSVAFPDLFFVSDLSSEHLERATRAFVTRLRQVFDHETFLWLVPDFINDFELDIVRRHLNAHFSAAQPLPRSIAAIFERVNFKNIQNDGDSIVVLDDIGGVICATKVIARFDENLKKRTPETNGFYLERCPPIVLSSQGDLQDKKAKQHYDMVTMIQDGSWFKAFSPNPSEPIRLNDQQQKKIGPCVFCFTVTNSPVCGGIRLDDLQQRAGDIPLWRDRIPELSIKVVKDGYYQRFDLVSRGTTIIPKRGYAVPIPISESFILPKEKEFYQFPLYQDENAKALRFSARLDSNIFPLKSDIKCELVLTFRYGDDEPYSLIFSPFDKSFSPIRATWKRSSEEIITDAAAPEYPNPMSWTDLQKWSNPQGHSANLLNWLIESLRELIKRIPRREKIVINSRWVLRDGYSFAFAYTENREKCYIKSTSIVEHQNGDLDLNVDFPQGTVLYANIVMTTGGMQGFDISNNPNPSWQMFKQFRERSLQNRMAAIWADGRSITDVECPEEFRREFKDLIDHLLNNLPQEVINSKIIHLLACLHRDISIIRSSLIDNLFRDVDDLKFIGFALGDISQEWQKNILYRLLNERTQIKHLIVLSYAIWREKGIVNIFSIDELIKITDDLLNYFSKIQIVSNQNKKRVVELLELLFGLLRIRNSKDLKIKSLLQPHQIITKMLAEEVDRIERIVREGNVLLNPRVKINIGNKNGVANLDLFYALRLYLTGDDGANAIHITSISDEE